MRRRFEVADVDAAARGGGERGHDVVHLRGVGETDDGAIETDTIDLAAVGVNDPEETIVRQDPEGLAERIAIGWRVLDRVVVQPGGQIGDQGEFSTRIDPVDAVWCLRIHLIEWTGRPLHDVELAIHDRDVLRSHHVPERVEGGGETTGDRDRAALLDL